MELGEMVEVKWKEADVAGGRARLEKGLSLGQVSLNLAIFEDEKI